MINTSWCKCEVAEQESLSGLHQSSTSGKNCAQWFDRIFKFNIIIDHGRSGEEEIETGQSPCLWVFVKRTPCPLIIVSLKPIVTPILRALNTSQAVTLDNSDFYDFTRLSAIINQFTNGNQVWLGCQWSYLGSKNLRLAKPEGHPLVWTSCTIVNIFRCSEWVTNPLSPMFSMSPLSTLSPLAHPPALELVLLLFF